jgi:hypothetical protein
VLEHVKALGLVHLDKHAPEPRALRGDPAGCFPSVGEGAGAVGALRFRSRFRRCSLAGTGHSGSCGSIGGRPIRETFPCRRPASRPRRGRRAEEAEEQEWPVRNEE